MSWNDKTAPKYIRQKHMVRQNEPKSPRCGSKLIFYCSSDEDTRFVFPRSKLVNTGLEAMEFSKRVSTGEQE
jgi:hypothetical protein